MMMTNRITYEQKHLMDKSPLKKVRMMDIVRKTRPERPEGKPTAAAWRAKEEQVKFTIDRKQAAQPERIPAVESIAYAEPKQEARAEPAPVIHPTHRVSEIVETKKDEVKHEDPRILETHPVGASLGSNQREEAYDLNRMIHEASSIEVDRPAIAYIPKEKTSREERRVLERIEKRERHREREGGKVKKKTGVLTWIVSCVLLGVVAYLAVAVLPRAEIVLMPKRVNWEYANTIGASTKIAEIDPVGRQIPVAVFAEKKTNTFVFPATGSGKSIERKATGQVTLYNDFSGSQQPLVAGTRLETPDGKIFRLKGRVVVPGATTSGGKLVAASIDADVIADKAGEVYNINPVSKFTIPGFKGTQKYDGFYGESKDPMTGGFIGEGKYPTPDDIKAGKESAEKQMQDVIDSFMATQVVPDGFKIIDDSKKYTIDKENVNEAVDDHGNFSIYMEVESSVDALKEDYVLKLMTALAQQVNGDGYEIKEHTLSYGAIGIDAKTGAISLPIEFKGTFWKPVNVDEFKRNVIGKKEDDLKSYVFSSTSIDKANVALWPFWVRTVPNDPDRVKVEIK